MAIWSRFFGSAVSTSAGIAIGGAVRPTLDPLTQDLANRTWALHPDVPPPAILLAFGVAEGHVDEGAARDWGAQTGFGLGAMDALIAMARTGPGVAQAFELWRRGIIGDAAFTTALQREGMEQEWITALHGLKRVLLSPAELANAVVQGFREEGAAAADAELQGISPTDFQTMVDVTGLPPGPETLQDWTRRGIISEAELAQGIREGHTKVKYIDEYTQSLARVLTAAEYAGLHLRGWISEAEMNAGGALTGYSPALMQLLFLNRGRPATPRQIRVGYARGATVPNTPGGVEGAITKAVKESDVRPEYTAVEIAASYSLPSPFVLRGLTQSGAFTEAQAEKILLESGWLPEYAKAAATFFASGVTAKTKTETKAELADEYETGFISEAEYRAALAELGYLGHVQDLEVLHSDAAAVKTERGRVVTALHKQYEAHSLDEPTARAALAQIGMHAEAVARILPLWNVERNAARALLTAAQVKRAYRRNLISEAEALSELEARGYSAADAATYLAE